MKDLVDELVDKRFKEQMFERYYKHKEQSLKTRIERLRRQYGHGVSPPRVQTQEAEVEEESSGVLDVSGPTEFEFQEPKSVQAKTKRRGMTAEQQKDWFNEIQKDIEKARRKREMDDIKAKLTGKK